MADEADDGAIPTIEISDTTNESLNSSENINASIVSLDDSQRTSVGVAERQSPRSGETCSICLDVLRNLAVCDPCFHSFCYPCINEWSRINNICPLCKSPFDKIHHDIKSNRDFKIEHVQPVNRLLGEDMGSMLAPFTRQSLHPHDIHVPFMSPSLMFNRRRSTNHPLFSVPDTAGSSSSAFFAPFTDQHSGSVRITTHTPNISISVGSFRPNHRRLVDPSSLVVPIEPTAVVSSSSDSFPARSSTISQSIFDAINSVGAGSSAGVDMTMSNVPDMLRGVTDRRRLTLQGRRLIYHHGFKVRHYNSNHFRDISLQFMQERPASITRIMQWANRELSVLVDKRELSSTLGQLLRLLRTVDIDSRQFYSGLVGKLGSRTSHFIHELKSFARSPFAVDEYDRHAMYGIDGAAEKIATEITNDDIEQWSAEEIQVISSTSGALVSSRSTFSSSFAPASSSHTCARARSSITPQLIVLSDDEDVIDPVRSTSTNNNSEMLPGTSAGTSSGLSGRRDNSRASKWRRHGSRSTLSARVISSDEDDIETDFAKRIKSVAINADETGVTVKRDRSPVRGSGKFRTRIGKARSSRTSNSRSRESSMSHSRGQTTTNMEEIRSATKQENVDVVQDSNMLTLDSTDIHQVMDDSLTSRGIEAVVTMGRVSSVVATDNVPRPRVEVKQDAEDNETQAISAVKSEHQVTSTSELIKTETNANDDVTMRTGMKSEVSAKIESKPNITSSVDQSGTSSSRQNEATGDTSVLDLDCEDMQVVSAAGNLDNINVTGNSDDIVALTDDLRPKAIVPDMSEFAAAEVNVTTTSDFPIQVSESEEDAIVFLREDLYTPPLVDLVASDNETTATMQLEDTSLPQTSSRSEDNLISIVRPPIQLSAVNSMKNCVEQRNGGIDVVGTSYHHRSGDSSSSDSFNDISRPTAPKLLKHYTSTSSASEQEREKTNGRDKCRVRKRLKRKRRRQLTHLRSHKRSTSYTQDGDSASPIKKFRCAATNQFDDDEERGFELPSVTNSEPAPATFGRFFSFGDSNGVGTSNENSLDNPIDLSMDQSASTLNREGLVGNHPLSGILSYSNTNGYSSDSEGEQEASMNMRTRYHPYI